MDPIRGQDSGRSHAQVIECVGHGAYPMGYFTGHSVGSGDFSDYVADQSVRFLCKLQHVDSIIVISFSLPWVDTRITGKAKDAQRLQALVHGGLYMRP